MKTFAIISVLCAFAGLASCKKEDSPPAGGVGDADYIEFKLNDTLRQIVAGKALSSSSMVLSKTSPSPYLFLDYADGTAGFRNVLFTQYGNAPIAQRRYTYSALSAEEFMTFSYVVTPTPSSGYKSGLNHTKGYFEITRLDSVLGGKIEGTFAYDSLYFENASHVRQPGWHRITEGRFRMTRE